MNWKEISLDDKALFDRHFWARQSEASDFTFTNFVIWRFSRQIHHVLLDDFLCIQVTYPGQTPIAFMPFGQGDLAAVMEQLIRDFKDRQVPFRMRALDRPMIEDLERALPGRLTFTPEPDRFDYVYLVEDLVKLEGAKFKAKRNHVNVFKQTYAYQYESMTQENLQEVVAAEIDWCKKRDCESQEDLENEKKGILEATRHFERLKFQGGLLKVDGRPVAFTFGEPLTKDMVVIHIEKADPDIRGAYQMIHQQFLERQWPQMTFVNREEDLGIEGLRKAKQSYNPVRLVEKFTAEEKK